MNPNFTWDDLQFFLAVARTGQVSTAARRLRTSHATVSRRIDRLEFALKVKLFERYSSQADLIRRSRTGSRG